MNFGRSSKKTKTLFAWGTRDGGLLDRVEPGKRQWIDSVSTGREAHR